MDADFCVAALEEALAKNGKPDIFNTDQGSQFTSFTFANALRENGIRIISTDGRDHLSSAKVRQIYGARGGKGNDTTALYAPFANNCRLIAHILAR